MGMRSIRRSVVWLLPASLLFLMVALAACGGNAPGNSTTANTSSSNTSSSSTSSSSSTATALTLTITEPKSGTYVFDKNTITIKKGDLVTIVNKSNEDLDFDEGDTAKAGVDFLVPGKGSSPVIFNTPGTFVIKSKAGASFTITVEPTPSSNAPAAAQTLTILPRSGGYTVSQPSITVNKGDMVTVVNHSSQDLDFDEGDASKAGVDFIVAGSGTANVFFNIPGTFVIKSKSGASFTVTVK
jgi:plastocyanin